MPDAKVYRVIGEATDPDERIRLQWGENLDGLMKARKITPSQLARQLTEEYGQKASRQAVESWIAGRYAPTPAKQAAIGTIFGVPARLIFTIENAAPVAA